MKILVVEDSPADLELLEGVLKGHCGDVTRASSPGEAFERLGLGRPGAARSDVDLVVIGHRAPGLDGVETALRIREDARLKDIPVILVTGDAGPGTADAAFAAGVLDCIRKPFDIADLLTRARAALRLKIEYEYRDARENELRTAMRRVEGLVAVDSLTGAVTRDFFGATLEQEWRRCARDGADLGIMVIDIDDFGPYRESFGDASADDCLRNVARAAAAALSRSGDVLAVHDRGRFVAIMPRTNNFGAAQVAERICAAVERLGIAHPAAPLGRITISAGLAAMRPDRETRPATLLAAAETALDSARDAGGNCVRFRNVRPVRKPFVKK